MIEPATFEDLPQILALQHAGFEPIAAMIGSRDIPALRMDLKGMEEDYRNRTILKYTENGKIVGTVRGRMCDDGSCYLGALVVDPGYQRRGIAPKLIRAIEAHFAHCSKYTLFTSSVTPHTSALYRSLGYREVSREPEHGVDLIFMEKENS